MPVHSRSIAPATRLTVGPATDRTERRLDIRLPEQNEILAVFGVATATVNAAALPPATFDVHRTAHPR